MADARERSIIFSAPMVRAILDGRKTMTRRIIKPQPACLSDAGNHSTYEWRGGLYALDMYPDRTNLIARLPWRPGDRAWVRETWAPLDRCTTNDPGVQALVDRGFYRADDSTVDGEISRWTPAIYMPRWASRLTLLIEDVRVQRLQDISEADARAEGCPGRLGPNPDFPDEWDPAPQEEFRDLWNSIHGDGAWDQNPWVAALTFRRIDGDHHG